MTQKEKEREKTIARNSHMDKEMARAYCWLDVATPYILGSIM